MIIIEAINKVLSFNKIVLMNALMEKPFPNDEMVEDAKKTCKIIAATGLYHFNTDCSSDELLEQIETFIEESVKK